MRALGIQWQQETDAVLAFNRLVLPTVLKAINCHTREFLQQLRNDNPKAIVIYRHYPNYDDWRDNPEQCAINAVGIIKTEIADVLDLFTHVEDNNEWVFPFFSDTEIDAADRYMETFITMVWSELKLRTVFLNSACGNWGDDVIRFWRTLRAAEWLNAVLGQHEYDWPTMMRLYEESGDYWLCGKWKKSMAAIKAAGYKGIKCIITEAGIDGGVTGQPMRGWKSVPNALENYCASLLWYNDLLIADDDVVGAALFIMSGEGMWGDFDIADTEVPGRIAQFPTVPPPEPPEEDLMKVKVVDMEYQEQTEEWVKAKYSIDWERAVVAEGEPVWRLVELWEKTGTTAVITQTLDVGGNPKPDVISAFRWKSAEQSDIAGPNDWWSNYVYGLTNANGEVGPSMGTGAYRGEGEPCVDDGPHQVWIHDDNIKSDVLKCICMLAGTFHHHCDCKFRLMTGGAEPPEPPVDGELLAAVLRLDRNVAKIGSDLADIKSFLLKTPPEPPDEELFTVAFFNNTNLEGPPVHTMEESAPFAHDWGLGSPEPGKVNDDYISGRWIGAFSFEGKTYRFSVKTDDGVRLWVGGELVIDQWFPQSPHDYHADVALTAGAHEIKLEWFEQTGGATIHLRWAPL